MVQANAKVERVSTKKLDDVISSQNTSSDKTGLGYTREISSVVNISKEVCEGQRASSSYPYYGEDKG